MTMNPKCFCDDLMENGIDFFTGVPDSLLASFCAEISQSQPKHRHVIAANEGAAITLACGYHLSTGKMGCVYMQNSGQGNAINPLVSMVDPEVYSIPMLLMIGWRGQPGLPDEPQHRKQGRITQSLQDVIEIETQIITPEMGQKEVQLVLAALIKTAMTNSVPVALMISKGFFDKQISPSYTTQYTLNRESVIKQLISMTGDMPIVSTTGKISRELFEARQQSKSTVARDFLTVGSMGHAISIATGVALGQPGQNVICLDGDGAALMHMGSMAIAAQSHLPIKHIVLNNAAHESVGGQPTVAGTIDLTAVASAVGYAVQPAVESQEKLIPAIESILKADGPCFLEVKIALGSRKDLGRPSSSPIENKEAFMKHLQTETFDVS